MDVLRACTRNEHPAISTQNVYDEKLLKDDFYNGLQSEEQDGLYVNNELPSEEPCLNSIFHNEEYIGKIKELQFHLDKVKKIVKPGCSHEVLDVALTSMSSLVKILSTMSSAPYPLASL